ncbi:hypothetical protein HPB48_006528 [Haemaphysalis longicornis]|uniref:Uncharacterized protein n=1 Tax=Haemaphysalis longicornis TaxID=44386 RepID=A0A9J6G8V2_HAELO|nr:hypothetical protein HPB48_006528 [Haemaphysalis longicornis]
MCAGDYCRKCGFTLTVTRTKPTRRQETVGATLTGDEEAAEGDGGDEGCGGVSLAEVLEELLEEDARRVDDAVDHQVADEARQHHHPAPASVRWGRGILQLQRPRNHARCVHGGFGGNHVRVGAPPCRSGEPLLEEQLHRASGFRFVFPKVPDNCLSDKLTGVKKFAP